MFYILRNNNNNDPRNFIQIQVANNKVTRCSYGGWTIELSTTVNSTLKVAGNWNTFSELIEDGYTIIVAFEQQITKYTHPELLL